MHLTKKSDPRKSPRFGESFTSDTDLTESLFNPAPMVVSQGFKKGGSPVITPETHLNDSVHIDLELDVTSPTPHTDHHKERKKPVLKRISINEILSE
jgi:hypothetical protein